MDSTVWPSRFAGWIEDLPRVLDARVQHRFSWLLLGMLLARGRKTVAAWLRAAGIIADWRRYYYFLGRLGKQVRGPAWRLLHQIADQRPPGERLVFALDDSPTERYGPCVEGAGIHRDPSRAEEADAIRRRIEATPGDILFFM